MKIPDKEEPDDLAEIAWGLRLTAGLIALGRIEAITERFNTAALLKQLVEAQCQNEDLENKVKELEKKMKDLKERMEKADAEADSAAAGVDGDGEAESADAGSKPKE